MPKNETFDKLIRKYNIRIKGDALACNQTIAKNQEDLNFLKENKPAIMDYINQSEKEAEERRKKIHEEHQAKLNAIEGLQEIRDAISDMNHWKEEFDKSFDDVGGLGVRAKPDYDFDVMYAKYPRAAAYLKAEKFSYAANSAKSNAGKKALMKILDGKDYTTAIEEMEKEWTAYCEGHIFD